MIIPPVPVWESLAPALASVIVLLFKFFGWFYKEVKGKQLVVLGMPRAGKTRFYRFLQNKPYEEGETGIEPYEEFEYKKTNGETIIIKKGEDIGGSEDYVKPYYEKMIMESDILVFCFDISKYMSDSNYEREVNARFDYIWRRFKDLKLKKENFVKLASHKDELKDPRSFVKEFDQLLKRKPYFKDFKYNFFTVDMTNKKDLEFVIKKIF